MKANRNITFTLNKEEDKGYCTVLQIFQAIGEDVTIPEDIRDRAADILNSLYEFDNDYFTD